MFEFMRNLLWWKKDKTLQYDGTADGAYHKLPGDSKRKSMTPKQLAILLSECKKETPAYILLSHELNLRLGKEQSIATWRAAIAGGLFALISAALGAWLTVKPSQECVCQWRVEAERPQANLQINPDSALVPVKPIGKSQPKPDAADGK